MTVSDAKEICKNECGYFVRLGDELLGIGIASGNQIDAVCSVKKGAGQDCVLALNHALKGERVYLNVASTNVAAIHLYDKLGFIKTSVISRWYKIL